jgi:four helix bundle protein
MPKLHDLVAFQRAVELTVEIYEVTNHFPKQETYGLTSQNAARRHRSRQ